MDCKNLNLKLLSQINESESVNCSYKFRNDRILTRTPLSIVTEEGLTTLNVNYTDKTGICTTTGVGTSPMGIESKTIMQDYCSNNTTTTINDFGNSLTTSNSIPLSKCMYNAQFTEGGMMFPMLLSDLIPIDDYCNCQNTQSYTLGTKSIKCGDIPADYSVKISRVGQNEYVVTTSTSVIDQLSGVTLNSTCNANIILNGSRKNSCVK